MSIKSIAQGQTATGESQTVRLGGGESLIATRISAGTTPTATVEIYVSVFGTTGSWKLASTHTLSGLNDNEDTHVEAPYEYAKIDVTALGGTDDPAVDAIAKSI